MVWADYFNGHPISQNHAVDQLYLTYGAKGLEIPSPQLNDSDNQEVLYHYISPEICSRSKLISLGCKISNQYTKVSAIIFASQIQGMKIPIDSLDKTCNLQ